MLKHAFISLTLAGACLLGAPALHAQVVAFDCFPITAAQEVPPTASTGSGVGNAWFDPNTNVLSWHIAYSGLTGATTAAHFHGNAGPGANAGVQINIGTANPNIGSAVLTAAQAAAVQGGLWYVNIHTAANPGGEIRGQVVDNGCLKSLECFAITPGQEVPPTPSTGSGRGSAWVNLNSRRLSWHVETAGLTAPITAAHFHGPAPVGVNAGVQVNIGAANPNIGSSVLTAGQYADLNAGLWYVNVHTTAFPGGEVRGQAVHTPCPWWTNLGLGKPGLTGRPALVGSGPLTPGSSNRLELINGRPGSTATLIVGFSNLSAPLKGGILVPNLNILIAGLPIDANGSNLLPFTWPVGVPAGFSIWMQEWIGDTGAHAGLAATNGLQLTAQ